MFFFTENVISKDQIKSFILLPFSHYLKEPCIQIQIESAIKWVKATAKYVLIEDWGSLTSNRVKSQGICIYWSMYTIREFYMNALNQSGWSIENVKELNFIWLYLTLGLESADFKHKKHRFSS